jgi:PAS domain S-box-containing protein
MSATMDETSSGLLRRATEEAARLLDADGAMVYLVDEDGGHLRFEVDAGIRNAEARSLIRDLKLPVGVGLFGTAVASGEVVATGDYRADRRFEHTEVADRIVTIAGMRSMAVAPLIAQGKVLGAMGAYSSRPDDFDDARIGLLRALADHAAAAIANARLIARLERSEAELARRVEAQRALGGIAADITSIRDPTAVLQRTVDEAARLLGGDGGEIGVLEVREGDRLHWAFGCSAPSGSSGPFAEHMSNVDEGISGKAVAEGRVVITGDYLTDGSFTHTPANDTYIRERGTRSVIAAPLAGDGGPLGSLLVHTCRPDAFDADDAELLGALADQAAIAVTNARLYDELGGRIEAQHTLAEITARLAIIHDPETLLQQVVDAAKRLLETDGAHLTLLEPGGSFLRPTVIAGGTEPDTRDWLAQQEFPIGEGINGLAAREAELVSTEDYLIDPRIPHEPDDQEVARRMGLRGMAAAPLRAPDGRIIGTLAVSYEEPHSFPSHESELLQGLADQAAIAISNAELTERLRSSEQRYRIQAAELERTVAAQRALSEIAAQITSLRDPDVVLQRTVDEAVRLLGADGGQVGLIQTDDRGRPRWTAGPLTEGAVQTFTGETDGAALIEDEGISGRAVTLSTTVWTGDYLEDASFNHTESSDAFVREGAIRSVIAAPLVGEGGGFGALTVYSKRSDAFDDAAAELLAALADQAAIAVTNARLYHELRGRIEAQRSVAAIAAEIAALHDPAAVIQRTADEATRLLGAETAMINPVDASGAALDWAVAHSPEQAPLDDIVVPLGEGISGRALQEGRVVWTAEYLEDESFAHSPALDEYIRRRGVQSVMSAPLVGGDAPIGTLTVQSSRRHAFGPIQAEMLEMLALQAAVAVTNARLYDELRDSERRYRFLVDNSPDIVWSIDAEGRFTFLSESLERQTGFKAEDFIGRGYSDLTDPASVAAATAALERLQQRPDEHHRVRIELPTADGGSVPVEITMMARLVDGQFAGAHGSGRDIRERERLERDLRRQAAELAAGQERAHLARELHDSVTQALFSMGLTIRSLELLYETDPQAARDRLAELRELQKDALAEMRTLIFELRPQGLEKDGLVQALRNQAAAVEGRTGLSVTVEADDAGRRLPLESEEALYRIAQEALHNVVKHAGASWVRIRFEVADGIATLSVSDDGAGFDPERVPRGHLGLSGMRQRADRLGGDLAIESVPGGGTTISVSAAARPIAAAASAK